jgi:hypothetical protein
MGTLNGLGAIAIGAPNAAIESTRNGMSRSARRRTCSASSSTYSTAPDENRVNGIQPRRAGAPAPMACIVID